jgi:hypothetical protein
VGRKKALKSNSPFDVTGLRLFWATFFVPFLVDLAFGLTCLLVVERFEVALFLVALGCEAVLVLIAWGLELVRFLAVGRFELTLFLVASASAPGFLLGDFCAIFNFS